MLKIGLALLAALALAVPGGLYGGIAGAGFFGIVAGAVAYVVIGRRVARRVEREMAPVERHVKAGRIDRAIRELETLRPLGRWQPGLRRGLDAQIGMLHYAHRGDAAAARPYLERAPRRIWQAQAMLGALQFRDRRTREMHRTFDRALRRHRKVSLLYAAYAYCEHSLRADEHAIEILARGVSRLRHDDALRRNLLALQNRKRMQMRSYGADWWALRLASPPRGAAMPPPGARPRRRRA